MAVGISSYKNTNGLMNLSLMKGRRLIGSNVICNGLVKRLYHADNLTILKALLKDQVVKGKIKLIYIDPPYNTGADFETRNQKFAYSDRFSIDEYINFMRERLVIMRELLSKDGSIYVHLDSNMVFHVKILMDSIFGVNNFRGMITRKKCKPKNYTRKTYGNISDYILFYTKSDSPTWNRPYDKWEDEKIKKEYPFIEEGTGRRYKRVPIHAPGIRNGATGSEWRGMFPPPGKHWQYTPDKLDELDANNEIYWSSNGNPRRKVYLDQSKGIPVQDIWLDFLDVNNQNSIQTGYPTEKNLDMIKRIIEASSNEGDLIMDCFAGSGTTLVAAEELNRQWIGVDIGDVAIETIKQRLEYGSKKISELDNRYNVTNDQGSLSESSDDNISELDNVSDVQEAERSVFYDFFQML